MTEKDNDHASHELTMGIALRADFLAKRDAVAVDAQGAVSAAEGLPPGSALFVVKRGPNAGSRFTLNQPVASAGRNAGSDIAKHRTARRSNS